LFLTYDCFYFLSTGTHGVSALPRIHTIHLGNEFDSTIVLGSDGLFVSFLKILVLYLFYLIMNTIIS
jgi:hypothetical protein